MKFSINPAIVTRERTKIERGMVIDCRGTTEDQRSQLISWLVVRELAADNNFEPFILEGTAVGVRKGRTCDYAVGSDQDIEFYISDSLDDWFGYDLINYSDIEWQL